VLKRGLDSEPIEQTGFICVDCHWIGSEVQNW